MLISISIAPFSGVWRWSSACVVLFGVAAGAVGASGALLSFGVNSSDGDGGVWRRHGRFGICLRGGGGCVRREGGVAGGDEGDGEGAMVEIGGALFFSCKE